MTRWEERIAGVFAERFPRSAAAESLARAGFPQRAGDADAIEPLSENTPGSRAFRLTAEQIFPDFEASPPEEKESFLEAVEALERKGLVRVRWALRRKREALASLAFPDPEAFFAFMGKPSPSAAAAEARLTAARLSAGDIHGTNAGGAVSAPSAYTELFRFLAAAVKPANAARGVNAAAVRDLAGLTAFFADGGAGGPGLTARALSIALYADSKRLEEILSLFARFLSAAEGKGIPIPEFSLFDRSFPETMIAGRLGFFFSGEGGAETRPLENDAGIIIGLPLAGILRIRKIAPLKETGRADEAAESKGAFRPKVLMVENKETFYALAGKPAPGRTRYDAILYAAGHPNRAVRALVGVLAASGFEFYHAGDLDIDGILILQELADMAGKPVTPVRMDPETFERYRRHGRRLEKSMLRRVSLIREETRNLPGIGELIKLIEETGLGVEQEIIDSQAGSYRRFSG
jgi:hypothetical protein